jgi:hypothetical protein
MGSEEPESADDLIEGVLVPKVRIVPLKTDACAGRAVMIAGS